MAIHRHLRLRHACIRTAAAASIAAVLLMPAAAAANTAEPIVFNARRDFQLSPNQANPSGAWSYRQTYSDGSRRLLTHFDPSLSDVDGVEAWTDNHAYLAWPWVPSVWFNNTGADYLYTPADGLFVHPSVDHAIVIRWTSPGAGRISIRLNLTDSDAGGGNGVGWSIGRPHHRAVVAGAIANGSATEAYVARINVESGDRIDLTVRARQEEGWDTTQVGLKILFWPE